MSLVLSAPWSVGPAEISQLGTPFVVSFLSPFPWRSNMISVINTGWLSSSSWEKRCWAVYLELGQGGLQLSRDIRSYINTSLISSGGWNISKWHCFWLLFNTKSDWRLQLCEILSVLGTNNTESDNLLSLDQTTTTTTVDLIDSNKNLLIIE